MLPWEVPLGCFVKLDLSSSLRCYSVILCRTPLWVLHKVPLGFLMGFLNGCFPAKLLQGCFFENLLGYSMKILWGCFLKLFLDAFHSTGKSLKKVLPHETPRVLYKATLGCFMKFLLGLLKGTLWVLPWEAPFRRCFLGSFSMDA